MKVVRGGRVLTHGKLDGGLADIVIDGDTIKDVTAPGAVTSANAEVVDATGRLVIPGLVNAHMHAQGNLAKGSGDRWTLELLIHHSSWITAGRSAEHHYLSGLIGAAEMIRKGCTTTYDLFAEFPLPTVEGVNALAQAYADAGMRAVVAPMMADRTFYKAIPGLIDAMPDEFRAKLAAMNATPYQASLEVCGRIVAGWKHDRDRIRPALAPTIPHHCTDDFLIASRDMARDLGLGLHTHVAESKVQAVVAGTWYEGKTLVGHLDKLGYLGPNFTAAHAVWLDDDDMKRFADNGVSVAHNPGSNLILGSGIAAVRRMREHGINVGIGTDGTTSSDNLNMFEAMRIASMVSRMQSLDTARWLSAEEAFAAATVGSAKALGMERVIGQIAPGFKADLVLLDLTSMNWLPLNDVIGQLIRCEDGTAVDKVMVGGTVVYADHRYTTLDPANVARQAEDAVRVLRSAGAEIRAFAAKLEPHVNRYCAGLAAKSYHVDRLGLHH